MREFSASEGTQQVLIVCVGSQLSSTNARKNSFLGTVDTYLHETQHAFTEASSIDKRGLLFGNKADYTAFNLDCLLMPEKPKLVIFDLDGTLIDTMGSFADLAGELIEAHYGWSFERGRKRYLETSGIPFFQQLELLQPDHQQNFLMAELFEKSKIGSFMKETISERVRETLITLREMEIHTAISSNNFHDLVKEFVHRENVPIDLALGFKKHFSKGRPHFDHLKKYFSVEFAEMMFVGDSLKDAEIARDIGIQFVARLGTFSASDFQSGADSNCLPLIYDIHEILEILEDR